MIALPEPRGAVTELLLDALARAGPAPSPAADADADEDLHLALYLCYELHYRGLPGVDDRWEWEPSLLALRGALERALRGRAARATSRCRRPARRDRPRAARDRGRRRRRRRSRSHLERDGHARAVPRVRRPPLGLPAQGGRPALVGAAAAAPAARRRRWSRSRPTSTAAATPTACTRSCSRARWTRSGSTRATAPTSTTCPAVTLATVNLMSMFGLHRRLRGAIVGHLALFEMTSSMPNRRYANGLRRLGFGGDATDVLRRARGRRRGARERRGGRPRRRPRASRTRRSRPTSCGAPPR